VIIITIIAIELRPPSPERSYCRIWGYRSGQTFSTSVSLTLDEVKVNGLRAGVSKSGALARQSLLIKTGGTMNYYAYLGPLGEIVRDGVSFFASKDGFLIGEYDTFQRAMDSLEWKGRAKTM
jgi:hypothetical protein